MDTRNHDQITRDSGSRPVPFSAGAKGALGARGAESAERTLRRIWAAIRR
jgi:hypothetical protein